MDNTIENLEIRVTTSGNAAANAFDRLASSAGRVRDAASGAADGMEDMAQGVRDAGTATATAGKDAERVRPKIRGTGKDAKDAGNNAKTGANGIKTFWSAIRSVGKTIKNISVKSFNMGMRGIQNVLNGTRTALGGLGRMATFAGKSIVSFVSNGFNSVGERIFGVVKAFSGLARSIGRIAFYRMIRSAIKMVTQGFAEGISNLYQWSLLVDHKFADSMDKLATASLYLKNSLGAMVSPLINALAPAVDLIVNKLVDAINLVNQFFAALTGQSTYTAAKKFGTAWAEAADKAAGGASKAAKEIRKTILGFDELNILNGNKDNGTGSGTGTSNPGLDYSSMFETRTVENGIGNLAKRLKDAFNKGDWNTIGSTFAKKINGLVDGVRWSSIGTKVANGVNAIVKTYNSLMKNVEWFDIGNSLADTMNSLLDGVDWNELGRSFTQKLNALGDTILGFAINFKWGDAGKAFATAIMGLVSNVKWDTLRNVFIVSLNGIIKAIREFMGSFSWGEAGGQFKNQILKLVDAFPVEELGDALGIALGKSLAFMDAVIKDEKLWNRLGANFATFLNKVFKKAWVWENAGKTINDALNGILTFGQSFLDTFQADVAATNLKTALGKIKWKDIASSTWTLIKTAFSKTGSFIDVLLNEDINSARSIDEAYEMLMFNNQSLGTKIGKKISAAIGTINWKQFGADIGKGARALFNTIADFFKEMRTNGTLETAITDFFGGLPEGLISSAVNAAKEFLLMLGRALGKVIIKGIGEVLYDPVTSFNNNLQNVLIPNQTAGQRQATNKLAYDLNVDRFGAPDDNISIGTLGNRLGSFFGTLFGTSASAETLTQYTKPVVAGNSKKSASGSSAPFALLDENEIKKQLQKINDVVEKGLKTISETTTKASTEIFTIVSTGLDNIGRLLTLRFTILSKTTQNGWKQVNDSTSVSMTQMFTTVLSGFDNVGRLVSLKYQLVNTTVTNGWNQATTNTNNGMSRMVASVSNGMTSIINTVANKSVSIANTVAGIGWNRVGNDIVYGIGQGIYNTWDWLKSVIKDLAKATYNAAKKALGINSPSRVFSDGVGKMIGLGMAQGIDNSARSVMDSMDALNANMLSRLTPYTQVGANVSGTVEYAMESAASAAPTSDNRQQEVAVLQSILDMLRYMSENPIPAEVTASSVQRALNRSNVRAGVTTVPVGQ